MDLVNQIPVLYEYIILKTVSICIYNPIKNKDNYNCLLGTNYEIRSKLSYFL